MDINKTNYPSILIVEDDVDTANLISLILSKTGYHTQISNSVEKARTLMQENYFPVIISDLCLGKETGLSLIPLTKMRNKISYIIFLTGYGDIDSTVEAIHEGAFEYLSKPSDVVELENLLLGSVRRALKQIANIKEEFIPNQEFSRITEGKTIIGKSAAMVDIYRTIAKASMSKCNVIIFGESGTGKELVARAIHEKGPLATRPFITINCGALTETLLESELFGHIRGSFTGAVVNKKGLFEEADGGTLFLDEIGDISMNMQVKLLRAIQEGEIRPVGSTETRKVNVRVISATHRDLDQMVEKGTFREDLYYRLKVFFIKVPPLRERPEDLPDLIFYFAQRISLINQSGAVFIPRETMKLLLSYSWPGNIRELENCLERAIAMSNSRTIFPEDLPPEIRLYSKEAISELTTYETSASTVGKSLDELEKDHILRVLKSVNYNKTQTAEILGIDRGTLYRRAQRYHISLQPDKTENIQRYG